jgi:hypothetical protein
VAAGSSQTRGGPESKASALRPASTMARSSVGRLITVVQTQRLGSKALVGVPSPRSGMCHQPTSRLRCELGRFHTHITAVNAHSLARKLASRITINYPILRCCGRAGSELGGQGYCRSAARS